jgi:pantoate--beta-alanine ligase
LIAEGQARPGHFRGVATIVTKLFNIVQPTIAYFGQKDAAQCILIRRMVHDLNVPTIIAIEDTIREVDGLAMSSRNVYLTEQQRKAAPIIYQSLCDAKQCYQSHVNGVDTMQVSADIIRNTIQQRLRTEPLVTEIQYIAIDDKETMQPLTIISHDQGAIISIACKIGTVRLIDNVLL